MALFSSHENRVKCGRCSTEFDLNKNPNGCPLCGFGKNFEINSETVSNEKTNVSDSKSSREYDYIQSPPQISSPKGVVQDSGKFAIWGMFNDLFSGKFMLRVNANLIHERKTDYVMLSELIDKSKEEISRREMMGLKGFPNNVNSEASIRRLVYHFLESFHKMGLFDAKRRDGIEKKKKSLWDEKWNDILIRPTREGLEFARLKNIVFDERKYSKEYQVLTKEEKAWFVNHLKSLDKNGLKEYSLLKEIFLFIKSGKNGKGNLWNWFGTNPEFISYITKRSSKNNDKEAFKKQLANLAQTFSSGKISLLREMGIIKNKRDDYTIIGGLE